MEEARLLLHARQELYGESDPATFEAMLQLGRTLRDAGELRQSERVLTTSLSLQNRRAEPDDQSVARTEFNLAIVLDRLGEHEAARRLWERVLESSDRENGPDSELSVRTATNLAITLRKLRRYGDEFPLRVRVLESTRRTKGPDHVETFKAEIDLAQTHRHLGNHELALRLFTEALAGLEQHGGDQRTILNQKWAIATELVALKRSKEAAQMFDQVVAGAVEHLEPDDPFRRSAVRQRRGVLAPREVLRSGPEVTSGRPTGRFAVMTAPAALLALEVDGVILDPDRGGRRPGAVSARGARRPGRNVCSKRFGGVPAADQPGRPTNMSRHPSSPMISMSSRRRRSQASRPRRKRTVRPEPSRRCPLASPFSS